MNTSISVIVPTTGRDYENVLFKCLDSLVEHTTLKEIDTVVVVYNPFPDATKEEGEIIRSYASRLGMDFLYVGLAKGYATAVNFGVQFLMKEYDSEYIVLVNDDVVFIETHQGQTKNVWLEMLLNPFKTVPSLGLSGPILGMSEPAGHEFLVFFCVMIKSDCFRAIGMLDEAFNPGGGEDTDFCIRAVNRGWNIAQAPYAEQTLVDKGLMVGSFPIYHFGEATVRTLDNWQSIFDRNSEELARRYNPNWLQWKLGNNCERAVIGASDIVPPREHARYSIAAKHVKGKNVFEFGCSSGYGWRYFKEIPDVNYIGMDIAEKVIAWARSQFGEDQNHNFIVGDINKVNWTKFDTIIAFEVIEHLENGKELAQELKKHARRVMFTTPYNEVQGLWGIHHKLHNLTEKDFPGFHFFFLTGDGRLIKNFNGDQLGLLVGIWDEDNMDHLDEEFLGKNMSQHVLCFVPTKGRYDSTLPLTLTAIVNQTRVPDEVLIYDDGEQKDLRGSQVYAHIFNLFLAKGINWSVTYGKKEGQHIGHQYSQAVAKDLIWRVDDDEVPESNVLENLLKIMEDPQVGAAAGLVLIPFERKPRPPEAKSDICSPDLPNPQWYSWEGTMEADHLYSTFVYRKGIADYCRQLSPVGHREETMLTHEIKRKGYKLIITSDVITWHFQNSKGGIRSYSDQSLWNHDEQIFRDKLKEWGIKLDSKDIIVLDCGLGDTLVFSKLISEIKEKYPNLYLAVCYPEVFEDEKDIHIISIEEASQMHLDMNKYSVYKYMADHPGTDLLEAYKQMYLGE